MCAVRLVAPVKIALLVLVQPSACFVMLCSSPTVSSSQQAMVGTSLQGSVIRAAPSRVSRCFEYDQTILDGIGAG